jgi:hypothetical protein
MKKTIGGTVTQFLYDRLNPVQELNSSNGVVANMLTGLRVDEYFTRTASSTISTLVPDALGSTIGLVTANNGPIATNYTYQPFGATTTSGTANGNSYELTGRENDGTGLCFYRAATTALPSSGSSRRTPSASPVTIPIYTLTSEMTLLTSSTPPALARSAALSGEQLALLRVL